MSHTFSEALSGLAGPSGDSFPAAGSYLQIESSYRLNKNATKIGGTLVL